MSVCLINMNIWCFGVCIIKLKCFSKQVRAHNYNDSISISLAYEILEPSSIEDKNPIVINNHKQPSIDTFCKKCPLLSKSSKNRIFTLVGWEHNCEHNGEKKPCQAQLEVAAKFLNLRQVGVEIKKNQDIKFRI